jgi:hypothetical protein
MFLELHFPYENLSLFWPLANDIQLLLFSIMFFFKRPNYFENQIISKNSLNEKKNIIFKI